MFGQRPNFGVSSSFGGFGTNTSTAGFGSSSFGRPVFGTPQTTASSTPFGTGSATGTTSLFGQNQPSGGGLFGSQSTGFSTGSSGFGSGSGLFGSSNTQTSTTGGLFGSTTSASGFNTNQNQPRPFSFGTPTTSSSGTGTSLFGTNNATSGGNLFSSSIGQSPGTVVKYNPVTGTDTMTRSGVTQNIQTKIEVITAMKEYENRSLEELRVEDYLAGRKAPQQQGFGFGQMGQQNKFMSQPATSSSWLSQSNTGGLFGAKPQESKPLFGTNQPTGFGASTLSGSALFGSNNPSPFGQSTTAPSTGFSFGQNNQNKPAGFSFGQTTSTPSIFGSSTPTQSSSGFGSSGFSFGNQNNQQGSIFGTQNKPAFGSTNPSTSLFSNKPSGAAFGGFGNTSGTASPFGTTNTNTGGSLFGSTNQNKTGFSLGTTSSGFGSATPAFGSGGLFGANNNQAKPGGLTFGSSGGFGTNTSSAGFSFNQPSTGGGLFSNPQGGGGGGGLFGNPNTTLNTGTNFGSGPGFGMNQMQPNLMGNMNLNNNVVNNSNLNNLIKALTHNPFGTSSLLKNAAIPTGKADELLNSPTNTSASNANPSKPSVSEKTPTYVLPSSSTNSTKPKPLGLNRSSNLTEESKKNLLFAGLDDKNESLSEDPFKMKTFPSVKKLNLKVFKSGRNNANNNNSATGQSTATNSLVNGTLNSGTSTSLTNIPTSPGLLESPTNRGSLTPLHENSPTPDIIKGRSNIKRLQLPIKNHLNDTLADFNEVTKGASNDSANINDLDVSESNKENNISIFNPPSIDELPETSNLTSPHPAGIKLTRAGYYTIPSMEDLGEMVDSDGGCLVENFTVGRYGYGNICFQGITNVAGLDLDSCVFIVRKEVEVYPEGVPKPPTGEELNKSAFVTLDCVWPIDKSTHEVIKCQERLDAMGWPQYLEKQCLKMEATFVEYRPETGSWVFKVKHFSKYGLQDDENEPPNQQNLQAGVEASMAKLPPPQKDVIQTNNEIPQKTPLSLSNFPSTLPLFGGRGSTTQGPPALGLTSPPQHTGISQIGAEVAPAPLRKKVFLDGSTADIVEEDMFDSSTREPTDSLSLCPLSPSAERLTLSSKAPPRAIQTLKSQLFFNDLDTEVTGDDLRIPGHPREKGEKREFVAGDFVGLTEGVEDSPLFPPKGSKKLLMGNESRIEVISVDDVTRIPSVAKETVSEKPKKASYSPPFLEIHQEETESTAASKALLRDPRSEYQLLASVPDHHFDLGREVTSHLGVNISLKESLASRNPKGIADTAAFMGRSFRVGWGPCLTLVQGGHPLGSLGDSVPDQEQEEEEEEERSVTPEPFYLFSGAATAGEGPEAKPMNISKPTKRERRLLTIEKVHLKSREPTIDGKGQIDAIIEACLQNVLECSIICTPDHEPNEASMDFDAGTEFEPEDDPASFDNIICHYFTPDKGINLLHRLCLTAAQIDDREDREMKLSSVFDLCAALWGRLDFYSPDTDGESQYALEQARKEAVSVWLEEVSENAVAVETERALLGDSEEDYLEAVFSHLTARQISKACDVCQEKGDHHLALLLSQSCMGDETPRQIMKDQLANWAWSGLDAIISIARLSLYTLLAGRPTHEASQGRINTCLALDWRRCLAIHMWYVCPTTATIAEAMKEYEAAAGITNSKEPAYCEEPKPAYLSTQNLPENVKINHDVCFQLLKLYVDRSHPLETLLETSGHTSDPMDVTMSWLLWCILQSLDYTLLPTAKAEALHISMATFLESVGSWHWAAFVILSIPDKWKRERDLMELLSRHLLVEGEVGFSDPFYREKEHFILKELRVPVQWVHEAKSIRAKSLNLVDEEAWYLIKAGNYNEAHKMILESIAPNAVINEDHEHLLNYLNEFLKQETTEKVVDWQNGGDIYLAYLEVIQQVNELRESRQPTASKVEKLRPRLMALCLRLNNLKCTTSVHRLCISEMSRMVVSVLRAILSDDPEGIRVLAQQVTSLPLTHECALEELNHITHQYLTTLTHVSMEAT